MINWPTHNWSLPNQWHISPRVVGHLTPSRRDLGFVQWSSKHRQVPIAKDEAPNGESSLRDVRIAFRMVLLPMASNELHDWVHCKETIHTFSRLGIEFKLWCCFCSAQTGKIKLMVMCFGLFSGEEFWLDVLESDWFQPDSKPWYRTYIYICVCVIWYIYMDVQGSEVFHKSWDMYIYIYSHYLGSSVKPIDNEHRRCACSDSKCVSVLWLRRIYPIHPVIPSKVRCLDGRFWGFKYLLRRCLYV